MYNLTLRALAARVALVAVMGATLTSPARSQTGGTLTPASLGVVPGVRARLIAADYGDETQVGTVTAVRGDSIVFRRDKRGDSQTFRLTHLAQLDVSGGRHARPFTGLAVGLVVGAGVGAAFGSAFSQTPSGFGRDTKAGGTVAAVAGAVAVPGAAIGLLIGSLIHTERWRRVSINRFLVHPQASIDVVPSQSGPRVALRVAARF